MTKAEIHSEEMTRFFLRAAYHAASRSPDLSTQNGAVIVDDTGVPIGAGCNDIPRRVAATPDRLQRPLKYAVTEHAERNAVYDAARHGHCTDGGTMFCCWAACADCARAIIQSGITTLITHADMMDGTPEHWKETIVVANEMLREAGVKVIAYRGKIGGVPAIRFNGKEFLP